MKPTICALAIVTAVLATTSISVTGQQINPFYGPGDNLNNLIQLKVTGNGYSDLTLIGFHPAATEGFDSDFDAYKIMGIYAAPQIYSRIPGIDLAVNILPAVYAGRIVQLGFRCGYDTTYNISALGVTNLDRNVTVYLEDKLSSNDRLINLNKSPEYSFLGHTTDEINRFILHYHVAPRPEGLSVSENDAIQVYAAEKIIYVHITDLNEFNASVTIYDISGKMVLYEILSPQQLNTINFEEKNGFYFVNVINNTYFCTGKVYLK